jgi:hypothetical protein
MGHRMARRVLEPPRRDARTIPEFVAPDAPPNRVDISRENAPRPPSALTLERRDALELVVGGAAHS